LLAEFAINQTPQNIHLLPFDTHTSLCNSSHLSIMVKTTVYGLAMSTCTRRVLVTLHEKKADFDLKPINFAAGEHKSPAYLTKQPFGQIPYLEEGDFTLYESRAICRYLDETLPGTSLTPKDAKQRGLMEQWISIEMSHHKSADTIVSELFFKKMMGGAAADQSVVDEASKKLNDLYKIMDKHLEGKTFLVGDSFTLADVVFMPYLAYLQNCEGFQNVLTPYPNVSKWWNTISSRDSWKKATSA